MAEYIDREALIQELDAKLCALHGELDENRIVYDAFTDGFEECVGEVEKFQFAADVAPVVRCRECKHHYWEHEPCHGKSVHYCKLPHMRGVEVFKEFFCYYGEREEGAE